MGRKKTKERCELVDVNITEIAPEMEIPIGADKELRDYSIFLGG